MFFSEIVLLLSETFKITFAEQNWNRSLKITGFAIKTQFVILAFHKYLVPTGLWLIGYLLFYQYPVPLGLSRRDNILVESKIKVRIKSRGDEIAFLPEMC